MYDWGLPLDIDATRIYAPPQAVGKVSQMQLASSVMYIIIYWRVIDYHW